MEGKGRGRKREGEGEGRKGEEREREGNCRINVKLLPAYGLTIFAISNDLE